MSPDAASVRTRSGEAHEDITVRRALEPGGSIVAAARVWALAFEAKQRDSAKPPSDDAELALYDALADDGDLKRAEVALYQAVLAADLTGK